MRKGLAVMTSLATAFVDVLPRMDKFEPAARKGIGKVDLSGEGKKAGAKWGDALAASGAPAVRKGISKVNLSEEGKKAGIKWGDAFAAGGILIAGEQLVEVGKKMFEGIIEEAREAEKTGAQTAAVIKSTGGAAKVSATQVGSLATAISNKVGVDDEAIQSGANLLLTFTKVRNETGKGNKVFDLATQTVTDMAAAMGDGEVSTTGLKAASIQVGKALNDPLKGITALTKVGVTFDDGQKKQIATMIKHHDVLGAQKIILGELNKEFGGSAAAGTTAGKKLGVVFGNIKESIGTAVLPVLDELTNWASKKLPAGLATVSRLAGPALRTLVDGIKGFIGSMKGARTESDGFVGKMQIVGTQTRIVFGFFKTDVLPQLQHFGEFLKRNGDTLLPLVTGILAMVAAVKIWTTVVKIATAVQLLWNAAEEANPIAIIILLLIGLGVALVVAYKKSETFRNIVQATWRGIQSAATVTWAALKAIFGVFMGSIREVAREFGVMKSALDTAWRGVKSAAQGAVRYVVNVFLGMVGNIIDGAARAFGWVPGLGGKLKKAAADFKVFRDAVNTALGGVRDKNIKVTASATFAAGPVGAGEVRKVATGGAIRGPGTGTSDSIPALLSNGEHVLTAREVSGFGGHEAVSRMRKAAVSGQVAAFASGGQVGFSISPALNGMSKFVAGVAAFSARVDAVARKLALAGGGPFSPGLTGAVNFARSQAGKPYVWGSAGPGGYDCSGFVSALVNVVQGRPPNSRRFSTGTLPAGLFAPGKGAFNIGWFTGNPGHVAATVNGVPMESRGGDGVVVGSRSKGAGYGFFNQHGHLKGFASGGPVLPGDAPFDILDPRGRHYRPGLLDVLQNARRFDSGGYLPPRSATLAVNGTDRWEPVGQPGVDYDRLAGALIQALDRSSLPSNIGREVHRNVTKGTRA